MAIIVGHNGRDRYATTITSRTGESGGSVGGVKKPGTWAGNTYMSLYNQGNSYSYRVAQRIPSLKFSLLNTTLSPLQYRRGSYAVTHSGTLLG
jgi:hypothetical protein